jgi:hypothetical protein
MLLRCPLIFIVLALPATLPAITTYSSSSDYTVATGGIFSGIAELQGSAGGCSGSLIAPDVVLTAGHCVLGNNNLTITFADAPGSPVYTAIAQVADPGYNPNNPVGIDDVGLVFLNAFAASDITIYNVNTDTNNADLQGQTITLAGYGESGEQGIMNGYGTLLAGLNTISGFWNGSMVTFPDQSYLTENLSDALAYDFNSEDAPFQSATAPANEAFICFGDSGGPSFLGNVLGNTTAPTIVGVHDFITSTTCGVGDIAGDQNIAQFTSFIATAEADYTLPEPGTWATLGTGMAVLMLLTFAKRTKYGVRREALPAKSLDMKSRQTGETACPTIP